MPMESIPPATVVWFRRDLRLSDNPALAAAVSRGGPVVAAWVYAPGEEAESFPGAASRVFLHGALEVLAASLAARGGRLVLRRGPTIKALIDLARESGADAVFANRGWDPAFLARDGKAPRGSWIPWPTRTSPTIRSGGNGSPGAGPTRRRTSASSTPRCRGRSSTPKVATCGSGFPSWPACPTGGSTGPGRRHPSFSRKPG